MTTTADATTSTATRPTSSWPSSPAVDPHHRLERHLGGVSHVDMCARSGTPALVGARPEPSDLSRDGASPKILSSHYLGNIGWWSAPRPFSIAR
jgi:hypothetical protein